MAARAARRAARRAVGRAVVAEEEVVERREGAGDGGAARAVAVWHPGGGVALCVDDEGEGGVARRLLGEGAWGGGAHGLGSGQGMLMTMVTVIVMQCGCRCMVFCVLYSSHAALHLVNDFYVLLLARIIR